MSYLRAAWRIFKLGIFTVTFLPVQAVIMGPDLKNYDLIPRLASKAVLNTLGIRVIFNGVAVEKNRTTLYVANHISAMDPIIMKTLVPGAFSGKSEVSKWPLVGWIGKMLGAVYVRRGAGRGELAHVHEDVARVFNQGRGLIMFPEGKISDGKDVLPFKVGIISVMFNNLSNVKLEKDVCMQPFSIRLSEINGQKLAEKPELLDRFVWGDTSFYRHFWALLTNKSVSLDVTAHPVMNPKDYEGYKQMAAAAQKIVRSQALPAPAV